jgi:predicted GIY-YIG superfamily endonuclease
MRQLDLPMKIDTRRFVLGAPVVDRVIRDQHLVEVIGGDYAGDSFIYIIHLYQKISRAQHYVGSTNDLAARLQQHRRTWPRYCLDADAMNNLYYAMPHDEEYTELLPLKNKVYRRKHTFLAAVERQIGRLAEDDRVILLSLAKKHTSNGLLMAANQRGINWSVARVFQADRSLEFALKSQKHISRHCPICLGDDLPF